MGSDGICIFDKRSGLPWFFGVDVTVTPDSVLLVLWWLISIWVSWIGRQFYIRQFLDAYPTELSLIVYFLPADNRITKRLPGLWRPVYSQANRYCYSGDRLPGGCVRSPPPYGSYLAKPGSEAINTTTNLESVMHANLDAKETIIVLWQMNERLRLPVCCGMYQLADARILSIDNLAPECGRGRSAWLEKSYMLKDTSAEWRPGNQHWKPDYKRQTVKTSSIGGLSLQPASWVSFHHAGAWV